MVSKSVFVTGCGPGGIGAALAKEFHRRGHRVFASGSSLEEQDLDPELARLTGIETLLLDVTWSTSIREAAQFVRAKTGGSLDMLINNAGIVHVMPLADMPMAEVRRLFDVNTFSVCAVTQAFLPLLLEAQGLVANIGSINAGLCPPLLGAYNASKAAVEAIGRTMRRELAPFGVRVVTIQTGSVRSALFDHAEEHDLTIPEWSLYAPLRQWVARRGYLESARFMELDEYAATVASDLLRDSPKPVLWRGGLSAIAWMFSWFGWETMLDGEMIRGYGLNKLQYKPGGMQ